MTTIQCFDAVGWAAGRASSYVNRQVDNCSRRNGL